MIGIHSLVNVNQVELEKMASEDFVLAKLPECWLIPQLKSWIEYREGKVITDSMNGNRSLSFSSISQRKL